jgi:hypothetical protein
MEQEHPKIRLKEISQRSIEFVEGKKVHPREPFYQALDRVLGVAK